jgi:phospholipid/cholesterol/gamma-HCH transport system substrate-binding protein
MPSAKKVSWAKLKVGIMAIAAMIILGVLIFYLTGSKKFFANPAILYTYMDDSAALAKGSPVRLNGFLIGNVRSVELSGSTKPQRIVRVEMGVEQDKLRAIPVDSVAAISAENVLGTKFINIRMGRSSTVVKSGAEIPSLDTREFDEVVASGYNVMVSAQGLLKRLDTIISLVESGKGTIGKFLVDDEFYTRLTATIAETQKVAEAVGSGRGTIGRLLYDERLYEELRSSVARIDTLLQDVQEGKGTAGKMIRDPALYDDARKSVAELRHILEDVNAGKGTAGKLLKDEQLHRQLSSTIARLDTTLEKLNSGQGTLGQLLVNPQLYESLNGATQEMNAFMKDFRANPKKFLRIKLGLF